jgi:hypothetical protein
MKLQKKSYKKSTGKVYDLQVHPHHSYTINNVVVHNSAAGSIISYLIGITLMNPLDFDLLFERFLNAGRIFKEVEMDGYEIEFEDGTTKELSLIDKVNVNRNGETLSVRVRDLEKGDLLLK